VSADRPATRPLLGPRSSRALSILLILIGALACAATAILLVRAVTTDSANTVVTLSNQTRLALDDSLQLPDDLSLAGYQIAVQLTTEDLPVGTRLLINLGVVMPFLCGGLAALALSRVLWTLHTERPFQRTNARLLVVVAVLWAVWSWITPQIVRTGSMEALQLSGSPAGLEPAVDSSSLPVTWFGLLLLLAVAEVFRRGARQARDVDGLV